MNLNEQWSGRRLIALAVVAGLAALLVPVGVEAAAPALMRLVDGDGTSKAHVDNGKVRVGDGKGALSVDGTTATKPAVLLAGGNCDDSTTLQPGEIVTSIFLTGTPNQYPSGSLNIYDGDAGDPGTEPLMSLKVYGSTDNDGEQNAVYASDSGFKVTGGTAWDVVCGGIIGSVGANDAAYSIFGYEN